MSDGRFHAPVFPGDSLSGTALVAGDSIGHPSVHVAGRPAIAVTDQVR